MFGNFSDFLLYHLLNSLMLIRRNLPVKYSCADLAEITQHNLILVFWFFSIIHNKSNCFRAWRLHSVESNTWWTCLRSVSGSVFLYFILRWWSFHHSKFGAFFGFKNRKSAQLNLAYKAVSPQCSFLPPHPERLSLCWGSASTEVKKHLTISAINSFNFLKLNLVCLWHWTMTSLSYLNP